MRATLIQAFQMESVFFNTLMDLTTKDNGWKVGAMDKVLKQCRVAISMMVILVMIRKKEAESRLGSMEENIKECGSTIKWTAMENLDGQIIEIMKANFF